jgi:hypothetical protein
VTVILTPDICCQLVNILNKGEDPGSGTCRLSSGLPGQGEGVREGGDGKGELRQEPVRALVHKLQRIHHCHAVRALLTLYNREELDVKHCWGKGDFGQCPLGDKHENEEEKKLGTCKRNEK